MASWLVLGCGSLGRRLVGSLADRQAEVRVLSPDPACVETLREEDVDAREADVADPADLSAVEPPVDLVLVAPDDPAVAVSAAEAARTAFPDAPIVAYVGHGATETQRERIAGIASEVVDATVETARAAVDAVESDAGRRSLGLLRTLRGVEGELAVVMHDNPDPDAIASALALVEIADSVGVPAQACYYGDVAHQENRALVNLLDLTLRNLDPDVDVAAEFGGVALVDHSRPGVNDQLPEETPVDVVIDHHPPRGPVDARFVDLRQDSGATSTLLAEYVERTGVDLDETLATALYFGIRIDTRNFTREVSAADFEAAAALLPSVNASLLERVESPSVGGGTLLTIARAIRNRTLDGSVLTTSVGRLDDRDSLSQAADRLLDMTGVTTTLVHGIMDDTVYVSARTRGTDLDLGETLRLAFDQIGSAGGHADMAGAQIPIGVLGVDNPTTEAFEAAIESVITDRFFEALRLRPGHPVGPYIGTTVGTDATTASLPYEPNEE